MTDAKTSAEQHQLGAIWSSLSKASDHAVKTADQARADVAARTFAAIDQQIAAAAEFSKVTNPKEFFELQARYSREMLAAYGDNVSAMTQLWASAVTSSLNLPTPPKT